MYKVGDLIWMVGKCIAKKVYPNYTYKIVQNGQTSVQNEKKLKLHTPSNCLVGQASPLSDPKRRPNMWSATKAVGEVAPEQSDYITMLDLLSERLPARAQPDRLWTLLQTNWQVIMIIKSTTILLIIIMTILGQQRLVCTNISKVNGQQQ